MKILITLIAVTILGFSACSNEKPVDKIIITRDTSINVSNAFSELFLDSIKIEEFIKSANLSKASASDLRDFYRNRNYQFAWFTEDGLAEQASAFWNLHINFVKYTEDSSMMNKWLHRQMDLLLNERLQLPAEEILRTELQLTSHFFEYVSYAFEGKVDPSELQWHIPKKKVNAVSLLDSLVANKGRNLEEWIPLNSYYKKLKEHLLFYYDLEKQDGIKNISLGKAKSLKPGDSALAIQQLKHLLKVLGDYKGNDMSAIYDPGFEPAVKQAQMRFGLKQDGVIGPATIQEFTVPAERRIEQILINLERMRWMPKEPDPDRIFVNIPDFKLHVFEAGKKVFDINVVVGTAANRTVVFTDKLKYVVFSPYWNIPRSIVKNEILPAMNANPGYLARNNMEQTGTSNGLPVIRQKPGPGNALGKVKFIFPNSYSIYFHDTPAKSLFSRENRAFSHGCIRLEEPVRMANYLLKNQSSWTAEKIDEAMNAGVEKWVSLEKPVPVIISYFTAWVDNRGLLNFRKDIYGHDKKTGERLFER